MVTELGLMELNHDTFNEGSNATWTGAGGEERRPRGASRTRSGVTAAAAIRKAQLPPGSPAPPHRE